MSSCYHIVMDAYPHVAGPHFARFAGAAIGCWIPTSVLDAELASQRKLREEGWEACSILRRSIVDMETYAHKEAGRVEYEQAIASGFCAHIHVREREVLPLAEGCKPPPFGARDYAALIGHLKRGAWSLYSRINEQWANGTTPDGDDFLPLWCTGEAAARWRHHWQDYLVTPVPTQDLADIGGLLSGVEKAQMWAGVELSDALCMVHPALLRRDLLA